MASTAFSSGTVDTWNSFVFNSTIDTTTTSIGANFQKYRYDYGSSGSSVYVIAPPEPRGIPTIREQLNRSSSPKALEVTKLQPTFEKEIFESVNFIKVPQSWRGKVELPDGTMLHVDKGKLLIDDDDAQIVYAANRFREFNRYLNASDLLVDFVRFAGSLDVRQSEVLDLPIDLFINWLIVQAAEADGESPPDDIVIDQHPSLNHKALPRPKHSTRCVHCGKYVVSSKQKDLLPACNKFHLIFFLKKNQVTLSHYNRVEKLHDSRR